MHALRMALAVVVLACAVPTGFAGVRAPIVLCHGFMGWGPTEVLGHKYWGGLAMDIEQFLNEAGYPAMTAAVGPISSNHDRACELFASIKGGRADYGLGHARSAKHQQHARTYEGLYPIWDEEHPIHVVGHSMGGQTARMLVHLLATDYWGLGTNERWVRSVTTICTPHEGTTLATMIDNGTFGFAEEFVSAILALIGGKVAVYDFKLDQWGMSLKGKEDALAFLARLEKTIGKTKDLSSWDLSPEGAREMNARVPTYPDVCYMSWAAEETMRNPFTGKHYPEVEMTPYLRLGAIYMGSYEGKDVPNHEDFWQNDGIVNTWSQQGPRTAEIVPYSGKRLLRGGVWNYMGCLESTDHMKAVGHLQGPVSGFWMRKFWKELGERCAGIRKPGEPAPAADER